MLSDLRLRLRPRPLALVLVAALGSGTVLGGVARAQNAGAAAEAQVLFDEARKLMNKGDFAHACPKFAASQQADPAAGTLLNLANCYEKNGQTASAWVTFKDAAAAARTSNHREWETRAAEHVVKLEKVLSRLTVRLGGDANSPAAAQLTIRRDDTAVGSALLGTAIPVDPGTHTVDATAPGKKPFHLSVDVAGAGERKEVIIPALENAPADAPPPVASADGANGTAAANGVAGTSSDGSAQRTVGIVLGGVGIAGGIVGAVTGIVAIGKNSSAKSICPNAGACPSQEAVNDSNSAHGFGTVSTVSLIAGGAFFAGGVVTYLLAPRHPSATSASSATSPSVTASPLVGNGQAGVVLAGHF